MTDKLKLEGKLGETMFWQRACIKVYESTWSRDTGCDSVGLNDGDNGKEKGS